MNDNKRLTQKLGVRLREFVKNNRWDPTKADSDNQVHDALDALEAERNKPSVEVCMTNRAEGDGGCGACALCCKEQRERAEKAEADLKLAQKLIKRLETDRDEARGELEIAENQLVRCNAVLIIAREGIRMNLVKINPTSESALKMAFEKVDAVIKEQKL